MTNLYTSSLLPKTLSLLNKIQTIKPAFFNSFYLSGGTALSLQLGHRISEDLDFFTADKFDALICQKELQSFGSLSNVVLDNTALNVYIDGVKIQLLHYPYKLLETCIIWDGIQLSGILDIACTKLLTVSQRGSKKDFIDLYFLLKKFTLKQLLVKLDEKYTNIQYNKFHILKSLSYFDDAENQPMPRMITLVSWDEVKQTITSAVQTITYS
jgi:predicted nucleotidyltransferase component of viral defense system